MSKISPTNIFELIYSDLYCFNEYSRWILYYQWTYFSQGLVETATAAGEMVEAKRSSSIVVGQNKRMEKRRKKTRWIVYSPGRGSAMGLYTYYHGYIFNPDHDTHGQQEKSILYSRPNVSSRHWWIFIGTFECINLEGQHHYTGE